MSQYAFAPFQAALPIVGETALYPVRRILCIARNYAAHAREMGQDPTREPPFFFDKATTALVPGGGAVAYPPATANLHHEIEMVVALGATLRNATPEQAAKAVFGYGVGIDFTRRDLQAKLKDKGHPWDVAKSFAGAAPVTALVRPGKAVEAGAITLAVNGQLRQKGDLSDMIWKVPEILAQLSQLDEIGPGDLVFTGTPDGVGPVARGDVLEGTVEGVGTLSVTIV